MPLFDSHSDPVAIFSSGTSPPTSKSSFAADTNYIAVSEISRLGVSHTSVIFGLRRMARISLEVCATSPLCGVYMIVERSAHAIGRVITTCSYMNESRLVIRSISSQYGFFDGVCWYAVCCQGLMPPLLELICEVLLANFSEPQT